MEPPTIFGLQILSPPQLERNMFPTFYAVSGVIEAFKIYFTQVRGKMSVLTLLPLAAVEFLKAVFSND